MLTKRGIKKFCWEAVGILLWSKDDIIVEKRHGYYWIFFTETRAPKHIIKDMWERKATGTKYERVQFSNII